MMKIKKGDMVLLSNGDVVRVLNEVGDLDPDETSFRAVPMSNGKFFPEIDFVRIDARLAVGVVKFVAHSDPIIQGMIERDDDLVMNVLTVSRNIEDTIAIISFNASTIYSKDQVFEKLSEAVSRWMIQTLEGSDAWTWSNKNFNIGDLELHLKDKRLLAILESLDIRDLMITSVESGSSGWSYDSVLPKNTEEFRKRFEPSGQEFPPTQLTEIGPEETFEDVQWDSGR